MIKIVFSSVSIFQPGEEATGYVIQAWCPEPGEHQGWHYLINPKSNSFFQWDQGMDLAKKIALAGEIDPTRWHRDYPTDDWDAWERRQKQSTPEGSHD
jgi:hypothetical protein